MPICTACGAINHEEDIHACDPLKVPQKGEEIRQDGIKINIETKEVITK